MTSWASPAEGPSAPVAVGSRLGDRYVLHRPIASGGMAQVWLAEDTFLSRPVAVKVLHPHLATDAGFVARFRREAVAAARLRHPSIVAIYDTISQGPIEAIVMELIQGRTLRTVLDETGPLGINEVLTVGASVASALDEAHRAGIVHRDIKPANIMVADDGRVLVMDFGIAKAGTDADLTATGTLLGTAKYLAPEQVTGGAIDPRSDLFSLGIVLFEALTGVVPFKADTDAATALARLHSDAPPAGTLRAGVPPELDAIVSKLTARRPEDRVARAGMVREALERLAAKLNGGDRAAVAFVGEGLPRPHPTARPPQPPAGTMQGPPLTPAASALAPPREPGPKPAGLRPPDPPGATRPGPLPAPPPLGGPPPLGHPPSPAAPPSPGTSRGSSSGPGGHAGPTGPAGPWSDGAAGGQTPVGAGPQRVVRSARSRLGAVAAVALLVGAVAWAAVAGVGPFQAGDDDAPAAEELAPPTILNLRSFDPLTNDDDKQEREDLVALAADGNPDTAWTTERYRGPALAGLKVGVGLLVELAASARLSNLGLLTGTEGWTMEVYVGEAFGNDPSTWGSPVATVSGGPGETQVDLQQAEGSVVLLWLRDTGRTDGAFRFSLSELTVG